MGEEELACTIENIFNEEMTWEEKCEALPESCEEMQDFLNFFAIFICQFQGNMIYLTIFSILAVYLIFSNICALVDEYISGAIVYVTEYYKMSEALAGVTLLAMANGAGDVVTALVSSGSPEGVSYNIGSLFGAGLFVVTFVMTLTIRAAPGDLILEKETVYRDLVFYIIATLMVIGFALYGKLTWWTSALMLLLYVALVVVVMISEKKDERTKE